MKLLPRFRLSYAIVSLVALTLLALAVAGARQSQAEDGPTPLGPYGTVYAEAEVVASSLNLRTGPHVSYTAVAYLMEGEEVRLVGRNRNATWVQIELYNGYRGWVHAGYIRPTVDIAALPIADVALIGITAFVTNDPIPVYTGSDAGYALVGWARPGDVLALNGRNDAATWVHVFLPDGRAGWARADSPFLPSASLNDLPIVTPFLDAASSYLAHYFVVYDGPGFLYDPVDSVSEGQTLSIMGRTADNNWVEVRLPSGRQGWIAAEIINVGPALANVPVVHGIAPPQVVGWQAAASGGGQATATAASGGNDGRQPGGATGTAEPPTAAPTATAEPTATPEPTGTTAATATAAPTGTTATTATPRATATAAPTGTAEPSATPEATGTADSNTDSTPGASGTPDENGQKPPDGGLPIVYVYATPDDSSAPILRVVPGQSVVLVGRTEDAEWVKIWLPGDQEGWVRADILQLEIDIEMLPVVEP